MTNKCSIRQTPLKPFDTSERLGALAVRGRTLWGCCQTAETSELGGWILHLGGHALSEFTAGILFRAARASEVEAAAGQFPQPCKIRTLNYRWSALFLADDSLQEPATRALIQGLSRTVPLLQFTNAEDHGWGYAIWDQGVERSSFTFNYDALYDVARDIAAARGIGVHLWSDEGRPYWAEILAAAKETPQFQGQFETVSTDAFSLFEIPTDDLAEVAAVLAPGFPDSPDSPRGRVETFRRALSMEEMAWLSYQYLERDGAAK